jgi:hypothetical protein
MTIDLKADLKCNLKCSPMAQKITRTVRDPLRHTQNFDDPFGFAPHLTRRFTLDHSPD